MKNKGSIGPQVILLIAGIVFLFISILGDHSSTWPLTGCFACLIIANLLKFVRMRNDIVEEEKEMKDKEKLGEAEEKK